MKILTIFTSEPRIFTTPRREDKENKEINTEEDGVGSSGHGVKGVHENQTNLTGRDPESLTTNEDKDLI